MWSSFSLLRGAESQAYCAPKVRDPSVESARKAFSRRLPTRCISRKPSTPSTPNLTEPLENQAVRKGEGEGHSPRAHMHTPGKHAKVLVVQLELGPQQVLQLLELPASGELVQVKVDHRRVTTVAGSPEQLLQRNMQRMAVRRQEDQATILVQGSREAGQGRGQPPTCLQRPGHRVLGEL